MKQSKACPSGQGFKDRVEGNNIILDGSGGYPKNIIILLPEGRTEKYKLIKSRRDKFQLNK